MTRNVIPPLYTAKDAIDCLEIFNKLDKYHIDYNKLDFNFNKYNKPFIDNLFFNISHSNKYSVVVTSEKKIGVDIEYIRKIDLSVIKYIIINMS